MALETLNKLRVVSFDWNGTNQHDVGFIAEEVAEVFPEAAWLKDGKVEGLRVLPLIALCVKSIQELQKSTPNGDMK